MRIDFTLIDDEGLAYEGSAELKRLVRTVPEGGAGPRARMDRSLPSHIAKSLPDRIAELRDGGFFREPRTATEVHEELRKTYHCQLDRVQMALLRLQRKKDLRKTLKIVAGRSQVAYVW